MAVTPGIVTSYRHGQQFAVSEMCGDVVRLGSQGLPVPVFGLGQLVQPDVGLPCGGRTEGLVRGQAVRKVKTSQLWVSMTAGSALGTLHMCCFHCADFWKDSFLPNKQRLYCVFFDRGKRGSLCGMAYGEINKKT